MRPSPPLRAQFTRQCSSTKHHSHTPTVQVGLPYARTVCRANGSKGRAGGWMLDPRFAIDDRWMLVRRVGANVVFPGCRGADVCGDDGVTRVGKGSRVSDGYVSTSRTAGGLHSQVDCEPRPPRRALRTSVTMLFPVHHRTILGPPRPASPALAASKRTASARTCNDTRQTKSS